MGDQQLTSWRPVATSATAAVLPQAHVFVSVDTVKGSFPEVSVGGGAKPHVILETLSASNQPPQVFGHDGQVFLSTPQAPSASAGTKLETLAQAASTQLPINDMGVVKRAQILTLNNGQVPQVAPAAAAAAAADQLAISMSPHPQRLICDACSLSLGGGEEFFQHWLEHHCRLAESQPEWTTQQAEVNLEHCGVCNHVFVSGTKRSQEHAATCCGNRTTSTTITTEAVLTKRKLDEPSQPAMAVKSCESRHCCLYLKQFCATFVFVHSSEEIYLSRSFLGVVDSHDDNEFGVLKCLLWPLLD